ncbi:hypothetical protein INT43_002505 [Umbelopsis isabellina]|uniref:Uncharacterized protein n=1 Tax=Mortierella isabellina TaxID=91625 RepID=A0A8H7ULE4_MORIS|nr:hypothetical protein INT43_002505 [Umbelopsis isabellina]
MVSTPFAILLAILIIPCIPIAIYLIGLLLPASHIVSRTTKLKTSRQHLWRLLTDVEQYPQWQPKLRGLVLAQTIDAFDPSSLSDNATSDVDQTEAELAEDDKIPLSSQEDSERRAAMRARRLSGRDHGGKETLFVEYTKYGKRTVVLIEQIPGSKLLRIMEERNNVVPVSEVGELDALSPSGSKPTFSGSWTFDISSNFDAKELSTLQASPHAMSRAQSISADSEIITLKVTQQGVIKKPMVRVSNMLLFGFHRSIDRFLKDLNKKIEQDRTIAARKKEVEVTQQEKVIASMEIESPLEAEPLAAATSSSEAAKEPSAAPTEDSSVIYRKPSSVLEKDWDLVSEIYERKKDQ